MKKYLSECIGTFILLFVGTGSVIVDQQTHALGLVGIAAVWGLVIVALSISALPILAQRPWARAFLESRR